MFRLLIFFILTSSLFANPFNKLLQKVILRPKAKEGVEVNYKLFSKTQAPIYPSKNINKDNVLQRFKQLDNVEDLVRNFNTLTLVQKITLVELAVVGQKIIKQHSDGVNIIRKLGKDGLLQARVHGDDVIDAVKFMGPKYKDVIRKTGHGSVVFYKKYIKPYKKRLIGTGLLALYLANPEKFHDISGNLTQLAVSELVKVGIEVSSAVPRGIWYGLKEKFYLDPVFSSIGVFFILVFVLLAFPKVRKFLFLKMKRNKIENVR